MAWNSNIFAGADVGPVSAQGGADLMYGPSSSSSGGGTHPLHPGSGFGLSVWLGVLGLVVLVAVRRSLPS